MSRKTRLTESAAPRSSTPVPTATPPRGVPEIAPDRVGALATAIGGGIRVTRRVASALAIAAQVSGRTVTPLGWVVAALAPTALMLGYRLGWIEFVAIGFAALILFLVAFAYLIGRSEFSVEVAVTGSRVTVGQPASGVARLTNRSLGRLLGARLEIPIGAGRADVPIPGLARDAVFEAPFVIPTGRRGVIEVGPVRIVRGDPVGILRRGRTVGESHTVIVRPKVADIPSASTGFIRDLEGRASRDITDSDVSFHALREYVPGDDQRYIHWKSTAKTGTHMVRQFEETRRARLVVALSVKAEDFADDDEFELAVSAAGSLGIRSIRDASEATVVVGTSSVGAAGRRGAPGIRRLSALSRDRLLDDLAAVDRASDNLDLAAVCRVAADRLTGISVVFLVCGSLTTAQNMRAASARFPIDVEVVVVVCEPLTVPTLRRSGGLTVLSIGYLHDLRLSLLKLAAS